MGNAVVRDRKTVGSNGEHRELVRVGLSTALIVSVSAANDTETPSLTRAAACLRFAGVIKFNAPISSFLPHRPQFDSSVFHRSYSSTVTTRPGARPTCGEDDVPTLEPTIMTANRLAEIVLMVSPH